MHYEAKISPKILLILVGHLYLATGSVFRCGVYAQWDFFQENCCPLWAGDSFWVFWVRDGDLSPLPLSVLQLHLAWTCAGPVHAAIVSVSTHMCQCCCAWKRLLSCCPPYPWLLLNLSFLKAKHLWIKKVCKAQVASSLPSSPVTLCPHRYTKQNRYYFLLTLYSILIPIS